MITELLQELIRIPSENNGVTGYENEVQVFYHRWLLEHGIDAKLIYPEDIPNFDNHPCRLREHDMRNRPIVFARLNGNRPGKTVLLLAHADTVPVEELESWNDSPFSGKIMDGCIYGRGSGDDKWGMALMAVLAATLKENNCDFPGTLLLASVSDEEFGGGNGIAALFAHGVSADEAIYLDGGSNQSIWHAGLGGGFCTVSGLDSEKIKTVIHDTKKEIRERLNAHACFGKKFFRIIEKQFFLINEDSYGIRFFHDTLPGDDESELKQRFEQNLPGCRFRWMSRFLKPALVAKDSPLVCNLSTAFAKITGRTAPVIGGVQSDQGLVMTYGNIPCVLFGCGRRGLPGASHQPNEFIEEKALQEVYETVLQFVKNDFDRKRDC